jgi:hypothetical protein
MSKPFSCGRDPRVDEILAMVYEGSLSRESARTALTNIGLEQFSEDYENGDAIKSEARFIKTERA